MPRRNRTSDAGLRRAALYPLSYEGVREPERGHARPSSRFLRPRASGSAVSGSGPAHLGHPWWMRRSSPALVVVVLAVGVGGVVAPVDARFPRRPRASPSWRTRSAGALVRMGEARAILSRGNRPGARDRDVPEARRTRLLLPGWTSTQRSRGDPCARGVARPCRGDERGLQRCRRRVRRRHDRVMRALEARQVERVVWVTLREQRLSVPAINDAIRAAAAGRSSSSPTGALSGHARRVVQRRRPHVGRGRGELRAVPPSFSSSVGVSCGPTGDLLVVDTTSSSAHGWERRSRRASLRAAGAGPIAGR